MQALWPVEILITQNGITFIYKGIAYTKTEFEEKFFTTNKE